MAYEPEYEDRPASIAAIRECLERSCAAYSRYEAEYIFHAGPLAYETERTRVLARDAKRCMDQCTEEIASYARRLMALERGARVDLLHQLLDQRRGITVADRAGGVAP